MHYRYMSEIGEHYDGEMGTGGVRQAVLDSLAAQYRQRLMQMRQMQAEAANPAGKSRHDQAALAGRMRMEGQMVGRMRSWLERQSVTLDDDGNIDWNLSSRRVVYDQSPLLQDMTRVRLHAGRLFTDDAHQRPLDTGENVTAFSGPGFAIYVMSETGSIHVSSHSVGYRHHSSLLAGEEVAGAGELKVTDGRLEWISNKSGHYCPAAAHFVQVFHQLEKNQVNLENTRVRFHTATSKTDFPSVKLFFDHLRQIGVDDYGYAKLLRYCVSIPFPQFSAMAATKGWRWVNDGEFAAGKRGVVTAAGVPVPHKDVRKWLKDDLNHRPQTEVQLGMGR